MKKFLTPLLAGLLSTALADDYILFMPEGTKPSGIMARVAPMMGEDAPQPAKVITLSKTCRSETAAQNHASAIEAGVSALPCIVLRDEKGPYAAIPLNCLTHEQISEARQAATAPEREKIQEKRRYEAAIYRLCARINFRQTAPEELSQMVTECRQLLADEQATEELTQFLGLRCLYPLLMQEYAVGYTGAHTPATEAKLLEAIAALEEARDLNPDTKLGKEAWHERERLRQARRKARQYE